MYAIQMLVDMAPGRSRRLRFLVPASLARTRSQVPNGTGWTPLLSLTLFGGENVDERNGRPPEELIYTDSADTPYARCVSAIGETRGAGLMPVPKKSSQYASSG